MRRDRYEALSYHTASRHVQQNVFMRAAKQAPDPLLLSGTISLAIHPIARSCGTEQNFIQARINL
ncbi:hypothetical protein [uncultured Campylobacter sp.]|uniref:hypothetical protein n=1 Tax=uncultured Campylobacter sp. TaxID=218934 RepID=UPI0026044938|nr:hypothetical protein [uncultured Campylobacter sp.]